MVETRENKSLIQDCRIVGGEDYCKNFQHGIISDDNVWAFDYNQFFFTEQSRKVLDTMHPKTQNV